MFLYIAPVGNSIETPLALATPKSKLVSAPLTPVEIFSKKETIDFAWSSVCSVNFKLKSIKKLFNSFS